MPFDGIAVNILANELNAQLENARVMRIFQPEARTLLLHLRLPGENRKLVISADPRFPRFCTTEDEWENPQNPPAFCMLLRKHLEPSRLLAIRQRQLERIVDFVFECHHLEGSGVVQKTLVAELMGKHSNVTLIDSDNRVIDSLKRLYPEMNQARSLFPGIPYTLPPSQGKCNPFTQSREEFLDNLRLVAADTPLQKALLHSYQGFSPLAASEVVRRAGFSPHVTRAQTDSSEREAVWHSFSAFLTQIQEGGQPNIFRLGGKRDWAAYRVSDAEIEKEFADLNNCLDCFYGSRIQNERIDQLRNHLNRVVQSHLERVIKKERLQRETLQDAERAEEWKKKGEMLMANLHMMQKGQKQVQVIDYYHPEQATMLIKLDPALSPLENAQLYFKKYTKAKNSVKVTSQQLEKTVEERNYLEETETHIELADSLPQLFEIQNELTRFGYISKGQGARSRGEKQPAASEPDNYISSDGLTILVGRNNRQNDLLTFRIARPEDLWLHAQKIPGSHVIIRSTDPVPETTIAEAAALAAAHSKAKTSPKVTVDYTRRKHVRKPAGAKPGFVIYDNFESIIVDPRESQKLTKKRP